VGAWAFAAVATTAAVVAPFLGRFVAGDDRAYLPDSGIELAVIVVLALGAALSQALGARRAAFAAGTAGAALLIAAGMVVEGATYPRRYARANDLRPLAEAVARHTPPGGAVVAYPDARLSLDFYVRRPVIEAATPEIAAALVSRAPAAVVTAATHWPALAAVLPRSSRVAASAHVGGRDYVVILP
jgi:hypothetical protein